MISKSSEIDLHSPPKGLFILNESEKQAINSGIKEFSDASTLAHFQPDFKNY